MGDYNIIEYGAAGDGTTLDTAAIQKAIDACHASGGGRVTFPGGHTFRSGTLILKSGVELHLEMGAVLKAGDELQDFNGLGLMKEMPAGLKVPSFDACDYDGSPKLYFLYAKDEENIAITGRGTIDGNERIFYGTVRENHIDGAFYPRSPLLYLVNIEHLTIQDVTLTGSAFWTVHLVGCRDVLIDGIRILNNLRVANCDGIDPDHCQNVRISNCYIHGADDGIVFKNTAANMQYGPCRDIVVNNCTIVTRSAAFKIGSESEDLFENITVSNCSVLSPSNRGIAIMLRDKGSVENVSFSNISISTQLMQKPFWWGDAEPISVTAVPRNASVKVGHVRNVQFHNINCRGENGILVYGAADDVEGLPYNIDNIVFDHVNVMLEKRTDVPWTHADIRPCGDEGILEELHHGLFAHHAGRILLRGCVFQAAEEVRMSMGPDEFGPMKKAEDAAVQELP